MAQTCGTSMRHLPTLPLTYSQVSTSDTLVEVRSWFVYFFTYFLLAATLIPISLYVTRNIIFGISLFFISNDLMMYDEENDEPCQVRTMSLVEELGQVTHVFSDKTGTLTSNCMEFRRMVVGKRAYGAGETAISRSVKQQRKSTDMRNLGSANGRAGLTTGTVLSKEPGSANSPDDKPAEPIPSYGGCKPTTKTYVGYEEAAGEPKIWDLLEAKGAEADAARELMIAMAVNHSVLIEPVDGVPQLSASSPDEQAFVAGAEYFGYDFVSRDLDRGYIKLLDKRSGEEHQVVAIS